MARGQTEDVNRPHTTGMPDTATTLCITHAATVTPLARDLASTWRELVAGANAIRPVTRFDTSACVTSLAAHVDGLPPLELEKERPSLLFDLLAPLLPELRSWNLSAPGTMLFLASTKAGIDVLERSMRKKRAQVAELLPHTLRQWLCKELGAPLLPGENVSAACASGAVAVIRAAQSILAGRCARALVLAADVSTPFTMSGFSALRALSPAPCRPFAKTRDGLTLGEGAATLLLMPLETARREGRQPLGLLTGWGLASDARHITAPARDGCGLIQAMRQALGRAGKDEVDAICAHGTGTVYNDAMELTAFTSVFASPPPFFSSKGALGHSMAASGAIEAALCLPALEHGLLPPTLGCTPPDDPEARAEGLVSPLCQKFAGRSLLSCNSGFGGVNAALLLEHPKRREG